MRTFITTILVILLAGTAVAAIPTGTDLAVIHETITDTTPPQESRDPALEQVFAALEAIEGRADVYEVDKGVFVIITHRERGEELRMIADEAAIVGTAALRGFNAYTDVLLDILEGRQR